MFHHPGRTREMVTTDQKHQLLLFSLGEGIYAADVSFIREIVADRQKIPLPNAPDYIPGIFNLRDEVVKVIDIRLIIPLTGGGTKKKVIVFIPETASATRFGMVVDDVYGIMEVPDERITRLDLSGGQVQNNFMFGFFSFSISGFLKQTSRQYVPGNDEVVWIDFEDIIRTIIDEEKSHDIVFRLTALFNPGFLLSGEWKSQEKESSRVGNSGKIRQIS
jgi:purine-binding chemotaxis protein CheW